MPSRVTKVTTNHNEIRRWAEQRDAKPACVKSTRRGNSCLIRLDFPGYSGKDTLVEIPWDEWFDNFDRNGLALIYQDRTAGGRRSNFNKLVSRETVATRRRDASRIAKKAPARSRRRSRPLTQRAR